MSMQPLDSLFIGALMQGALMALLVAAVASVVLMA